MADTVIEWTQRSWNPIVGCSLASPGCTNCYAMRMARRLELMGVAHYTGLTQETKAGPVWTGKLALAPEHVLLEPLRRRKPATWFVNSMGDLFHEDVPDAWIDRVFAVMALAPQHTFQVLTKRAGRMRAYLCSEQARFRIAEQTKTIQRERGITIYVVWATDGLLDDPDPEMRPNWPLPNVWLGVSAEDQKRADERIPDLLATPAAIRFVSAEPLLGPIDFEPWLGWTDHGAEINDKSWGCQGCDDGCTDCPNGKAYYHVTEGPTDADGCPEWVNAERVTLDWIIVGGESGPKARPMHPDWARSIRDQCAAAGTAFFFKQWGEWAEVDQFDPTGDSVYHWDSERCGRPRFRSVGIDGQRSNRADDCAQPSAHIYLVGKKRAGRLLDGVKHNAMPEVRR